MREWRGRQPFLVAFFPLPFFFPLAFAFAARLAALLACSSCSASRWGGDQLGGGFGGALADVGEHASW